MAESDKTTHISESKMERFSVRTLSETELTRVATHLTGCPDCQAELVSTLRRQRGVEDLSFTLAPEFWLRHDHLTYEHLVEFAESKLDATERELIDAHLKVCPPCEEDVRSFLAFRKQIEPEMNVSYAPVAKEPAHARLTSVSWWHGLAWKPVYSAALIVLGIALMIGAALLLNRRAENQQAQQEPTPQVSPSSTGDVAADFPSPNGSPSEKPIDVEAVVALNDKGGTIKVDRNGTVSGLDDVPESTRDAIAKVLLTERIEPPAILRELGSPEASLRSSKTAQPFRLLSPTRTVIVSAQPALRWEKASGASSYRVYVYDQAGNEVARSEELPAERTEWTLRSPLKRSEIYVWSVVALVDGKEIVSPGPSSPEMKFQVLSTSSLQYLNQLKKTRSHLALGVFYARVGLLSDAKREFQQLVRLNPESRVASNLLHAVQVASKAQP